MSDVQGITMTIRMDSSIKVSTRELFTVVKPSSRCRLPHLVFVALLSGLMSLPLGQSQVIHPGPHPKVYLPERCDGFAVNGLHTGLIYSHSNSDHYTANTDCTVLFSIHSDYVMKFTFEHFELQNQMRGKCEDYVQFFAGHSLEMTLTEPLCGRSMPAQLVTNSSRVALRFRTNEAGQASGFRVRFQRTKMATLQCHDKNSQDCQGFVAVQSNTESSATNATYNTGVSRPLLLLALLGIFLAATWRHS